MSPKKSAQMFYVFFYFVKEVLSYKHSANCITECQEIVHTLSKCFAIISPLKSSN